MGREESYLRSGRDSVDKIDGLIESCYDKLLKKVSEQGLTIGEFLKMIDMRMKVAAKEPGNKEFWDMLDKIRKAGLGEDKPKASTGRKQPAKARKEKAA
ncbi:MAG: hypothetical protein KOO62_08540 [candidate division Zixibacteria bacterium]|nr:hypothetical protein [candidate division Zixibacteria bacterium]